MFITSLTLFSSILLLPSVTEAVIQTTLTAPMFFKLVTAAQGTTCFCGENPFTITSWRTHLGTTVNLTPQQTQAFKNVLIEMNLFRSDPDSLEVFAEDKLQEIYTKALNSQSRQTHGSKNNFVFDLPLDAKLKR